MRPYLPASMSATSESIAAGSTPSASGVETGHSTSGQTVPAPGLSDPQPAAASSSGRTEIVWRPPAREKDILRWSLPRTTPIARRRKIRLAMNGSRLMILSGWPTPTGLFNLGGSASCEPITARKSVP